VVTAIVREELLVFWPSQLKALAEDTSHPADLGCMLASPAQSAKRDKLPRKKKQAVYANLLLFFYPRKNGQAELTGPGWLITYQNGSTN